MSEEFKVVDLRSRIDEKEKMAIEFLQAMERPEGYYLAFSGGKDSCVCKHLCDKAGVKYKAVYRVTSVDPPELVKFIKEKHPDVIREIPHDDEGNPITMWNLCVRNMMLPLQQMRFCCKELKETGGKGMLTITGVRWAESSRRARSQGKALVIGKAKELEKSEDFAKTRQGGVMLINDNAESRQLMESCYKKHKTLINPIIDWEDNEVWEYIRKEKIEYCSLYDKGFTRIGCIGCPMATYAERARQFRLYPKYKEAYIRTARKIFEERKRRGKPPIKSAESAEEFIHWWIRDPNLYGQMSIFDEEVEEYLSQDEVW